MIPHFIEVHQKGVPYSINLEHLGIFGEGETRYRFGDVIMDLDESYDDIKDLIRKAGCQITKADPRLDTAHPIPWEDLVKLEMLGQPVFNSNTRKWMLLIDSAGPYTHDWIVLLNDAGAQEKWTKHDAQKYPLYRMRQK